MWELPHMATWTGPQIFFWWEKGPLQNFFICGQIAYTVVLSDCLRKGQEKLGRDSATSAEISGRPIYRLQGATQVPASITR